MWTSIAARLTVALVAAPPATPQPSPSNDCPTVELVRAAARGFAIPDAQVDADLMVEDRGEAFWVRWQGRERLFQERDRDCSRRARLAATFMALSLSQEAPPAAAAPVPEAPPITTRLVWRGLLGCQGGSWWGAESRTLGAGASLQVERDLASPQSSGPPARLFLGAGVGGGLTGEEVLGDVALDWRLAWVQAYLGWRHGLAGRFSGALTTGPVLMAVWVRRQSVFGTGTWASAWRPALQLGWAVEWPARSRIGLRVGPEVRLLLAPLAVDGQPEGRIGSLPGAWLGLTVAAFITR